MIHYSIGSENPAAHYFDVELDIDSPDPKGQVLRLPAWIPGSYMIRDFARNIVSIHARTGDASLEITQLDKSSWQVEACAGAIQVSYRVYAWDLSVRSAHLDTTHGFFNGTSVFLEVVGQSDVSCNVEIRRPQCEAARDWRLATTLTRKGSEQISFDFGHFTAQNYQELIDHPVEMGDFVQFDFEACGIRHDMVLSGRFECDTDRLKQDLVRICEQHINLFGEPAPMPRYLFLVMVVGDGYGGLEHRSSTSLLCTRQDLPHPGDKDMTDEYRGFLGLCSHEYFHSWNVKRIKPAVFQKPDLSKESYTPLLWAFEGITSYYDDLALLRSGRITIQDYLQLLGQTMTRVQRGPGRLLQSAAESSFNAWSKFYKQDENAPNAIVSYYAKGALIALCMDLKIRQASDNSHSLDDVMRKLWQRYLAGKGGVEEHDIQQLVNEVAGEDLSDILRSWIYGTDELPLAELLEHVSVKLDFRTSAGQQDKGGKAESNLPATTLGANVSEESGGLKINGLRSEGAAMQAGLSAGDIIMAVNGLRADMKSYQRWLKLSQPGSEHRLHAFRRDELMEFNVILQSPQEDTAVLSIGDENNPAMRLWLGQD